jgi:flagellar biosynthetic protein FlhB
MAESPSGGEKTETATGKRREDGRKEGQVCVSRDMSQAIVLMFSLVMLSWCFPSMMEHMRAMLVTVFENCTTVDISMENIAAHTAWFVMMLAWIVLPFMLAICVVAYLSMYMQIGSLVKEMKFDLGRMNPIAAAKRMFSSSGVVKLLMDLVKLFFISLIVRSAYVRFFPAAMALMDTDVQTIALFLAQASYWLAIRVFFFLFILAIFDYAYQKWKYEEDMKMTKEEVKEEMKSQEGDPQIKQKIRAVQLMIARRRMLSSVPKADVVITNPIHYAVAVQYDLENMAAPMVVAKGARKIAQRIKEIAREHNVPIVENKPLAQALFKDVEIGQAVPEKLFKAVADVLAFVYKLNRSKMAQVSQQFASRKN